MRNIEKTKEILKCRVAPSKKVAWRIYKNAAIIFLLPFSPYPKQGVFMLKGLQKDIWRQIKNRITMGGIVKRIAKKEQTAPEDVEAEVVKFINGLKKKQLVDIYYEL